MNTRAVNFPLMDSIRAIALLSVVAAHTALFIDKSGQEALTKVRFDFGVRVFFVISAFLLWRPFVRARIQGYERPSFKAFGWRRALRIVPAFWAALTAISLWLSYEATFEPGNAAFYYGFAQIYDAERATNPFPLPQGWSLCVEVVFYALLPLMAVAMLRVRAGSARGRLVQELVLAGVLFVIAAIYKVWIVSAGTLEDPGEIVLQLQMPAFLDDFALGMALAALSVWYEGRDRLPRVLALVDRYPVLPWALGLVALWVVSTQLGLTGQLGEPVQRSDYLARHYLFSIVALGLVLPAMFGSPENGLVRKLLAWRPLLYLGMVSYAVYLYHFAVLIQLDNWDFADVAADTTALLWYPVALGGGVLLATLSYYIVERPFLRLKRLVPQRPEPDPGEALAEPAPAVPPRPQTG